VRDPVTGSDVQIEDAHIDFKTAVDNPVVSDLPSDLRAVSDNRPVSGRPLTALDVRSKREPGQGDHSSDGLEADRR
jgi:hypothetical protein